jgi:hypothetical protein
MVIPMAYAADTAHGLSVEERAELIERYNSFSDQEKQDLLDQVRKQLESERPNCDGKAAALVCAFERVKRDGIPASAILAFMGIAIVSWVLKYSQSSRFNRRG